MKSKNKRNPAKIKKTLENLDPHEKNLMDSIESGEWKPIPNEKAEIRRSIDGARNQLARMKKEARISLRLNPIDIELVREMAAKKGLPYQTLIASVVHQYATHQLVPSEKLEERLRRMIREELEREAS